MLTESLQNAKATAMAAMMVVLVALRLSAKTKNSTMKLTNHKTLVISRFLLMHRKTTFSGR